MQNGINIGINALASIVQVQPSAANDHQNVVIDCLEDKDETLRRKTLDLLYRMTSANNVNIICTKLLDSLRDSVDTFLRTELVAKITELAEKFAPDTIWLKYSYFFHFCFLHFVHTFLCVFLFFVLFFFSNCVCVCKCKTLCMWKHKQNTTKNGYCEFRYLETMSDVFELGADLVKPEMAHNFIRTLAMGIEESEDAESEEDVAQYAGDFFLELLETKHRIPAVLLKVIAWVLGEYGHVATGQPVSQEVTEEQKTEENITVMDVIRRMWKVVEAQGLTKTKQNHKSLFFLVCLLCLVLFWFLCFIVVS